MADILHYFDAIRGSQPALQSLLTLYSAKSAVRSLQLRTVLSKPLLLEACYFITSAVPGNRKRMANQQSQIDGGSDPDGCAGCAWGAKVREWLRAFSSLPSGGYAGMGYY